ncbi:MAG: hypothetical protein H8D23_21295 [Candidatus Brocadiales bacterium]|nr:hypothetical protein [Candidatus Brocadiales bacterium]
MDEIQIYQPSLPAHLQKELDQQLARVSQIGQVVFAALEGISFIHRVSVLQAISTSTTVSLLKKAAATDGMSPELEAHLKQLEQNYFQVMSQIPQEACEKILKAIKDMDIDKPDAGLFAEIKGTFQRLLKG